MNSLIITIIIVSSITTIIADLLLTSGRYVTKEKQTDLEIIKNTKYKNLVISAILGSVSILFWMSILYYLMQLKGTIGFFTSLTFAMYIGSIAVFHSVVAFAYYIVKKDENDFKHLGKIMSYFVMACVITSVAFTSLMLVLAINGTLKLSILNYLTLPFFSTILIQFILGSIMNKFTRWFKPISGTLSMLVSFLSLINIMINNL